MTLSKDRMREYQRERRAKLKEANSPSTYTGSHYALIDDHPDFFDEDGHLNTPYADPADPELRAEWLNCHYCMGQIHLSPEQIENIPTTIYRHVFHRVPYEIESLERFKAMGYHLAPSEEATLAEVYIKKPATAPTE